MMNANIARSPLLKIVVTGMLIPASVIGAADAAASGPLRRHPANPRYFTDDSGRAVLLTGSHTWNNLVDLAALAPHGELASSRYCLANPGVEYLAYSPAGSKTATVTFPAGTYAVVWFDTVTGKEKKDEPFAHTGGPREFPAPFEADGVLYVRVVR